MLIGIVVLVFGHSMAVLPTGMKCQDHPLYRKGMRGEIIKSWVYAPRRNKMFWAKSVYIPRNTGYNFVPHDKPKSKKFIGLDYFLTAFNEENQRKYLTLLFQRQAKVYLLVHGYDCKNLPARLEGWKSEGWVRRINGDPYIKHRFGIGERKGELTVAYQAYVFSKVGDSISIPPSKVIKRSIKFKGQMRTAGHFSLLIAESNGDPVREPAYPKGMRIRAGQLCPSKLHEKWVASELDRDDTQTKPRTFATWHPLWDPCFYCSYGHEHGSAAPILMGYKPRYGYTALKNYHQDEDHVGFKDIVADVGSHWLYLSVHARMSSQSRFDTRHHTMVIAAVRKSTRKLELELRFKADYGSLAVRKRRGGIVGVSKVDEKLRRIFGDKRRHRLVNIINPKHIDSRWRYKKHERLLRGHYEQWATKPICSKISSGHEPTVDFKDPALAKRDVKGRRTTKLGRIQHGRFQWNASVDRELRSKGWVLGGNLCEFGDGIHGKFYTDVFGQEMKDGPGANNVRQFMKKGFRMEISGDFQPTDPWLGLYRKGHRGKLQNIAFGIDEKEN